MGNMIKISNDNVGLCRAVPDAVGVGAVDGVSIQESEAQALNKEKIFLSTIAYDAVPVAREYGFGLEIAEYCTAWNMDEKFPETDASARSKIEGISNRVLHAPFNELFPCAIDPKARELAANR